MITVDLCSDLHGHYPKLEGGDLLIVAGDLTAKDDLQGYIDFKNWIIPYIPEYNAVIGSPWNKTPTYKKIVIIAGNHDGMIQKKENGFDVSFLKNVKSSCYLEDSGTEFEGLKIWGSPWTKTFQGMNPKCKAFTMDTEEELAKKWALIPDDTGILITHSPCYNINDETTWGENVGSTSLSDWWLQKKSKDLKLWVTGHIHESYEQLEHHQVLHINASHVNERYEPVNKPIRVIL
jgi:Icc-related predicted phosphoesterase